MRKTALTLALLALLLGACQAAIETPAPDRKTPLPGPYDPQMLTPVSEATLPPVDGAAGAMFPEGVYNAQIDLAGQLGITAGEVQVLRLSGQEWPDGCLGLGGPEEACAAEVTPGYLVTLLANGRLYEYRINEDGSQVRAATAIDAAAQTAVQQARWLMVDALGGEDSSYQVVDVQPVEWADSCLGLPVSTDQICEAVTMPGYRILLSANDTLYEVHTNTDGTQSAIAGSDSVPVGQIFLRLTTSENPDVCREILAGTGGVISGACDGGLRAAAFGAASPVEVHLGFGHVCVCGQHDCRILGCFNHRSGSFPPALRARRWVSFLASVEASGFGSGCILPSNTTSSCRSPDRSSEKHYISQKRFQIGRAHV